MSLGGPNHVRWARELSWPRLLNMVSLPSGLGSASSIFSFGSTSAWAYQDQVCQRQQDRLVAPSGSSSDLPRKEGCWPPLWAPAGSHLDVPVAKGIGRATRGARSQILLVLAPCSTMLSKSSCEFDGHRILRPRKCHWSQSSRRRDLKPDVTLSFV